jgi:hypothetical protein
MSFGGNDLIQHSSHRGYSALVRSNPLEVYTLHKSKLHEMLIAKHQSKKQYRKSLKSHMEKQGALETWRQRLASNF